MSDKQGLFNLSGEAPIYQLIVSLVIILTLGSAILGLLLFSGGLILGADLKVIGKSVSELTGNNEIFIRYLLVCQDVALFVIPSIIIMKLMRPNGSLSEIFRKPQPIEIGLVIILTICVFPVTGFTSRINAAMHLPSWLSGLEKWMIDREESADNIIDSLVVSGTFSELLLNLAIIAIIPAIAEEMIFRGVFQRIFGKLFKSGHMAVIVTALLFSTFHFQFFGFIPRLILGLIFGYLFLWSGSLWLPVISHFINNSFPLMVTFFQGMEKSGENADVALWRQAIYLPLPLVIIVVVLIWLRKNSYKSIKNNF